MAFALIQIAFRAEIHANNVFLFFKNHFWYQHIKTIQKVQTALNFSKKKKKIWNSLKSRLNQSPIFFLINSVYALDYFRDVQQNQVNVIHT